MMKTIEKLAMVAIVLVVVGWILYFAVRTGRMYFLTELNWSLARLSITEILASLMFFLPLHVGVAIWLFRLAKREEDANPRVWALFGLVFTLVAVILFYTMRIYENTKPARDEEQGS